MESSTFAPEHPENQPVGTLVADTAPPQTLVIERLLRDRSSVWRQINHEYRLNELLQQMLISSVVSLCCYGFVMGISHSIWQALASGIKLPTLFLLTITICLPTLYLFNLFYGGRLSVRQVLALALAATTITSAMTLAFAPITIFFLITAQGYSFFVLLNVAVLTLTGITGLQILVDGTKAMNVLSQPIQLLPEESTSAAANKNKLSTAQPAAANMQLIHIWLGLFAFVGTQLGWTLRPFFGMPDTPFTLFRGIEGNFYEAVANHLIQMLLGQI